jgi:hypothetical protein
LQGNDDQAFRVLAAMAAAEYGFQSPPPPYVCWQELCINAFNYYVRRWNTSTCGGGLQWRFHPENAGFYYKNAVSNGAFFQLSARLLRLTGNQTYFNWANKIYDWSVEIGLVDHMYNAFDGADDTINCTGIDHVFVETPFQYTLLLRINFKTVGVQYCTVTLWLSRHAELHRWLKHPGTADFWLPRRNRHLLQSILKFNKHHVRNSV